jgi:hypothetical protein
VNKRPNIAAYLLDDMSYLKEEILNSNTVHIIGGVAPNVWHIPAIQLSCTIIMRGFITKYCFCILGEQSGETNAIELSCRNFSSDRAEHSLGNVGLIHLIRMKVLSTRNDSFYFCIIYHCLYVVERNNIK